MRNRPGSAADASSAQDQECDEQEDRHGEPNDEYDTLPRPAQDDFTPARFLGRVGCRLSGFLSDHRTLVR
jgi:hypothetical protein